MQDQRRQRVEVVERGGWRYTRYFLDEPGHLPSSTPVGWQRERIAAPERGVRAAIVLLVVFLLAVPVGMIVLAVAFPREDIVAAAVSCSVLSLFTLGLWRFG